MRLLLHTCCAPCLLYPLEVLRLEGVKPTMYFYNPNIHPYLEYERRVKALRTVAAQRKLKVLWDIPHNSEDYGITAWLNQLKGKRDSSLRCPECYRMRLEMTAQSAVANGYNVFSTTLLYSKYQMHNLIKLMGFSIGNKYGLDFYYRDFRLGWKEGIDMAKEMDIYRQPYCGCIFSEQERYEKRADKLHRELAKENARYIMEDLNE